MKGATTALVATSLFLALGPALPPGLAEGESFGLEDSKAVLRAGGVDLRPISVLRPAPDGELIGGLRVRIEGTRIVAVGAMDGREKWIADAKEGDGIGVHAVGEGHLWCSTWERDPAAGDDRPRVAASPGVVKRLRLSDGRWTEPPVALPEVGREGKRAELVDEVIPLPDGAVVVSAHPWKRAVFEAGGIFRATRFRGDPPAPVWSRLVPYTDQYAGPVGSNAGFIPREDGFAGRRTAGIAGKHLVLCPSDQDALVALDLETGEVVWRLERPGDWERWFIGPSVWSSGISLPDGPGKRTWRVFGGPVAVPYDRGDGTSPATYADRPPPPEPGYRLFLVVAREKVENRVQRPEGADGGEGTRRRFSDMGAADSGGHNADPIVYEVNDRGRPVAMATLPCEASLSPRRPSSGGALFLGALPCGLRMGWLVPTFQHDGHLRNHTSQHWARVAWWRHLPESPVPQRAKHVFRLPASYERPRAAGPTSLFRVDSGAFVTTEDPSTLRFPLAGTHLATGADDSMEFRVPFRGSLPTDRFSGTYTSSEEGWTPAADGPPAAYVSGLALAESRLYVTVVAGVGPPTQFVFDLPER